MEMTQKITEAQVNDEILNRFEINEKIKLPTSYRIFLINHNGGRPQKRKFSFIGKDGKEHNAAIHYFYALYDGEVGSLARAYRLFSDRLPLFHMPIARDAFGNLLVIPLRKVKDDSVYFWDHEQGDHNESSECLQLVSKSFEAFVEGLIEG